MEKKETKNLLKLFKKKMNRVKESKKEFVHVLEKHEKEAEIFLLENFEKEKQLQSLMSE